MNRLEILHTLDWIHASAHRQHSRWFSLAALLLLDLRTKPVFALVFSENTNAETDRNSLMNWLQGYTFEKVAGTTFVLQSHEPTMPTVWKSPRQFGLDMFI